VGARAGQVAVAAGVVGLGALVLWGSYHLPTGGGYAQVGPGVVPRIVGVGLLLLGALLVREALAGGFSGLDEEGERSLGMDWAAFAWITAGIFVYGLAIVRAGFIVSSIVLFMLVARGFGSRRWLLNAVASALLASGVFALFNYGLGLTLPAGVLAPLLE
jgi:putative tricarboxylic transport membrane protein